MKRKQFSDEQIIGILKEAEAGAVHFVISRAISAATCSPCLFAGDDER